jgi:NADPH-dependent 2,4-dienoyl-CoA reductase/sulfur reductase-like enzyme
VTIDVLVVGAGPAGLAAAVELRRAGVDRVLVADREETAGGVPRHCQHTGFGLRDLHRVLTGPAYARRYAAAAAAAGAEIRTGTTVTGWAGPGGLTLTSPHGIETVRAAAVLLATGCRERPRPARLVPGSRGSGIMTTGELQQRVYLHGQRLPGRAVVVGAEHVSFSALVTLAHAGAGLAGLVTGYPAQQSYPAFALAARLRWRVPVWVNTTVSRVVADRRPAGVAPAGAELVAAESRLAGVELTDGQTGATRFVRCDLLVFTGDWIPDHELARAGGVPLDPGTRGPAVDTALETGTPLVFAAGNLIHPAETADVAALSGRHAARHIAAALAAGPPPAGPRVPLTVEPPLRWIAPSAVRPPLRPPSGRFLLRCDSFQPAGRLEVRQGARLLASARTGRLIPARPVHLTGAWVADVDPAAGPVQVRLVRPERASTGT